MRNIYFFPLFLLMMNSAIVMAQSNINELLMFNFSNGQGLSDDTYIYINDNAQSGLDLAHDARKLLGAGIAIYTRVDTENLVINSLPFEQEDLIIPMSVWSNKSGSYTLTAIGVEYFDPSITFILQDLSTGTYHNLRSNNTYTFNWSPNSDKDRFLLRLTPPLEVTSEEATCEGQNGIITLYQPGSAVWNYQVKNSFGKEIAAQRSFNGIEEIDGLPTGSYTIKVTNSQGYTLTKYIYIEGENFVDANFIASIDTAEIDEVIQFTNFSEGNGNFVWDFGDGTRNETDLNPSHSYNQPGRYLVSLSVDNGSCADKKGIAIEVSGKLSTGIGEPGDKTGIRVVSFGNKVTVYFDEQLQDKATIEVYNTLGQLVNDPINVSPAERLTSFYLNDLARGCYFVQVKEGAESFTGKVILGAR